MRTSKRDEALAAAHRVVQRDGVTAVTFESVAAEAQLTKGGLMYHFPTRKALLIGLHEHLAAMWEGQMVDALGANVDDAAEREKLAAYAQVAIHSSTRGELLLMLEATTDPVMNLPWRRVLNRWVAPAPTAPARGGEVDRFIARLAADGLWLYEALTQSSVDLEVRRHVAERVARQVTDTSADPST